MNAKMNLLALALLGLAGYAGSAVAGCPSSPVPPWTSANQFQGVVAISAPGLDGSACHMDSQVSTGASGFATAQVEDDTPASEPRYRAAFMINTDALTSPTLLTTASVFTASSSAGGGVTLYVFSGGSGWLLSYFVTDSSQPSGYLSGSTALTAGANHVEFDLQIGASGSFTAWVNNNDPNNPTVPAATVNNASITGIDTAYLGLAAPSDAFVGSYAGVNAQFDAFDSRRQTFIGF
jgi:hypothetical protein